MLSIVLVLAVMAAGTNEKPEHTDHVGTARWMVGTNTWGVISTTSTFLDGMAWGNPISFFDSFDNGVPYFYVSLLDQSQKDIIANPKVTLALSEAAEDCDDLGLDPEDPPCVRLSLSGTVVSVTDADELASAKAGLFAAHPAMESWPADHNWVVQKLEIEHLWLIPFFGGAIDVDVSEYLSAEASYDHARVTHSYTPSKAKPFFSKKAETARWLAHEGFWGVMSTTSVHLDGQAFGNIASVADANTGTIYFYVSPLDTSMQDIAVNPDFTFTLSEASVDADTLGLDPEDPRCVRLSLAGSMVDVTDQDEHDAAKAALIASHPAMASWPADGDHHFEVTKLEIRDIWLIDTFGGASHIEVEDYYAVDPEVLLARSQLVV